MAPLLSSCKQHPPMHVGPAEHDERGAHSVPAPSNGFLCGEQSLCWSPTSVSQLQLLLPLWQRRPHLALGRQLSRVQTGIFPVKHTRVTLTL